MKGPKAGNSQKDSIMLMHKLLVPMTKASPRAEREKLQ